MMCAASGTLRNLTFKVIFEPLLQPQNAPKYSSLSIMVVIVIVLVLVLVLVLVTF